MRILKTVEEVKEFRKETEELSESRQAESLGVSSCGLSVNKRVDLGSVVGDSQCAVGLVPTMGFLHEGHLGLIRASQKKCHVTVVSIFINQTQFNEESDFEKYPKDLRRDLDLLQGVNVDAVFAPEFEEMYPFGYRYKVTELLGFSDRFCGLNRPGHFDGVHTVIMKLLGLVRPHFLFMGEKDFQQYRLVHDMVEDFFFDTKVEMVETVREDSGLAMSSRNERLSHVARSAAGQFQGLLASDFTDREIREKLSELGYGVDYVESFEGRRFGAVRLEGIRLIDNVKL